MASFRAMLLRSTAATFLLLTLPASAEAPWIDPADDAQNFGSPHEMLFWSPEQKVAGFRNINKIFWTRRVEAGGKPFPLPQEKQDLDSVTFRAGDTEMTVDEYFRQKNVAGLIALKDGAIVYERYGLGNSSETLWISMSVTKSVVSMLVGAAINDGYIHSVADQVTNYLPLLRGSAYDQATIQDIMQMASGIEWNEDYSDPNSDIASADFSTLGLYQHLRQKPAAAPPGQRFNYNTAETNLVGTLLRSAIGNNLSTYLSEKIWKPFGMEADANWMLSEPGGGEVGGCCLSATLRDYARLGQFALQEGVLLDGTPVVPNNWMAEATSPSRGYAGFGYLWWLHEAGGFRANGIFGQGIYVNPKEQIVVALQSARDVADNREDWDLQFALFDAVTIALNN